VIILYKYFQSTVLKGFKRMFERFLSCDDLTKSIVFDIVSALTSSGGLWRVCPSNFFWQTIKGK